MSKKEQAIKISTLKDIVEKVPVESLEVFLGDLKVRVKTCHKVRDVNDTSKKLFPKLKSNIVEVDESCIMWIDDGKNEAHVDLNFKT